MQSRSGSSRRKTQSENEYLGDEKEWLFLFSEKYLQKDDSMDYFVFGHRHLPIQKKLSNRKAQYINIGDWMNYNSYGKFDGQSFELLYFNP